MLPAAEPLAVVLDPAAPRGGRFSSEGNWKGKDTGTSPPSIPNPRGRDEGVPNRPPFPAVDTWTQIHEKYRKILQHVCDEGAKS